MGKDQSFLCIGDHFNVSMDYLDISVICSELYAINLQLFLNVHPNLTILEFSPKN